jgi:histidinol phosphatase-like enzyme (inositol monophosphatase family)
LSDASYLDTAHVLADRAGAAILPHFRKTIKVENKEAGGFDPVTVADKAAERAMRKELARLHPDHTIVGEEYAAREGDSDYKWVLDPIDGTRAFIMGYPLWGVLIGLMKGERAVVGMMDQPFTKERIYAVNGEKPGAGKGTFWRGADGKVKRVKTRACNGLSDAILTSTAPDMFKGPGDSARYANLSSKVRMTRFGGDCYAYCLLAAGHIDLVVEAGLKTVDIVALIPIIEQAGGVVTSWDGGTAVNGGRIIAAGDPRVHAAAMKVLAG